MARKKPAPDLGAIRPLPPTAVAADRPGELARKNTALTTAAAAVGRPLGQRHHDNDAVAVVALPHALPSDYVAIQRVRSEPAALRNDIRSDQDAAYQEVDCFPSVFSTH
jgi:hypothetical protein